MGSQSGGGHETPIIDWIAVYVMLAGAILLGLALPMKSWWIAIAGFVVGLIGLGMAVGYGIMNNTEDYAVGEKRDQDGGTDGKDAQRPASPRAHRITSA